MRILSFLLVLSTVFPLAKGQAVGLRLGKSLPYDTYVALRYEQATNRNFFLAGEVYHTALQRNGLNLSSIGLNSFAIWPNRGTDDDPAAVYTVYGIGPCVQYEYEPWISNSNKGQSAITYGLGLEASGEWAMSSAFRLTGFLQQQFLLHSLFGGSRFAVGLGLKLLLE